MDLINPTSNASAAKNGFTNGRLKGFLLILLAVLVLILLGVKLGFNSAVIDYSEEKRMEEKKVNDFKDEENLILKNLNRIPESKKRMYWQERLELKEREYFAFRLKNWKWDESVRKAEQSYNDNKFALHSIAHNLSFCIPILSQSSSVSQTLYSLFNQHYSNYHIFIRPTKQLNLEQ